MRVHHRLGTRRRAGRVADQRQPVGIDRGRIAPARHRAVRRSRPWGRARGAAARVPRHTPDRRQHRFGRRPRATAGSGERAYELGGGRRRVHRDERGAGAPDGERGREVGDGVVGDEDDPRSVPRSDRPDRPPSGRRARRARRTSAGRSRPRAQHAPAVFDGQPARWAVERGGHQPASARWNITTHCPSWHTSPCWLTHRDVEGHDAPVPLGRRPGGGDRLVDVDRVADAHRRLEVPRHAEERDRRAFLESEPRLEPGRDREHARPVEDPSCRTASSWRTPRRCGAG